MLFPISIISQNHDVVKVLIKNEMNFKKMRKSERFAKKSKENGIYFKFNGKSA